MKESLQNRIDKLHSLIQAAECVIVGGGFGTFVRSGADLFRGTLYGKFRRFY